MPVGMDPLDGYARVPFVILDSMRASEAVASKARYASGDTKALDLARADPRRGCKDTSSLSNIDVRGDMLWPRGRFGEDETVVWVVVAV